MSNISFNPLAWAIKPLYQKAISEDALFAKEVAEKESRTEKPKSLDECADYILGEAYDWASNHRDGSCGFAGLPDEEMVNLIKHYYDEENITIKKIGGATAKVAVSKDKKTEKKAEPKKAVPKVVKLDFPKETLSAGLTPMIRPNSEASAKKVSKAQAKAVEVIDMFAGMWDEEEEKPTPKPEEVEEEIEDVEEVDVVEEDDDDLPL